MSNKITEIIVETDAVGSTIVFAVELVVGYATNTRPTIINKAVKNVPKTVHKTIFFGQRVIFSHGIVT